MTTATATGITMTGAQLHHLFTAVLPSAATDSTLPLLNAVHVETGPYGVHAAATDRYTFAVARHADPAAARRRPAQITVPRAAVAAMLRLVRRRDETATIRIRGGWLTLRTSTGTIYRTPAADNGGVNGGFPDWRELFTRMLGWPELPGGQPVCLNPAFLARFAVTADGGLRVTIRKPPHARGHALIVTAGDWFIGALMSIAVADDAASQANGTAAWHADLRPAQAA